MRIVFLVLGILLFSSIVTSSGIVQKNYNQQNITINETGELSTERISISIDEEGNIKSKYSIEGSILSIGDQELGQLINNQFLDVLEGIELYFHNDVDNGQSNLKLRIYLRTETEELAQQYAQVLIDLLEAVALINFDLDYISTFEYWNDNGHNIGTELDFSSSITVNDVVPFLVGLLMDYQLLPDMNFSIFNKISLNVWYDGERLRASISFHYPAQIENPNGPYSLSLNDLLGIGEFRRSGITASPLRIEINLPSNSVPEFTGIDLNADTTVTWENWTEDGTVWYSGVIELRNNVVLTGLGVLFDYGFTLWSWGNHDQVYWEIDERGFDRFEAEVFGRERLIPTPNLAYNSTLLTNTLYADIESSRTGKEGGVFVVFEGESLRNQEFTDIIQEFVSIGLNVSLFETFNETTQWFIPSQENPVNARKYWTSFDLSDGEFTSYTSNFINQSNSALLNSLDISQFEHFLFQIQFDRWGLFPTVEVSQNGLDSGIHPSELTPRFSSNIAEHQIDPLNLPFLNIENSFPWNDKTEDYSFYVRSPFSGGFTSVILNPDAQWVHGWWSNIWFDDESNSSFTYELMVDNAEPKLINDAGDPTNISPDFLIQFNNQFVGIDSDLKAPLVIDKAWRDWNIDDFGYNNHDSWNRNFERRFSGEVDLITIVQDYGAEGWWYNQTSDQWIELFPSSGVDSVTGKIYYNDFPVENDLFVTDLVVTNQGNYNNEEGAVVFQTSFITDNKPDGLYEMEVTTSDLAGNTETTEVTHILVDNYDDNLYSAADLSITSQYSNWEIVDGTIELSADVTDDVGIYTSILWINGEGYILEQTVQ